MEEPMDLEAQKQKNKADIMFVAFFVSMLVNTGFGLSYVIPMLYNPANDIKKADQCAVAASVLREMSDYGQVDVSEEGTRSSNRWVVRFKAEKVPVTIEMKGTEYCPAINDLYRIFRSFQINGPLNMRDHFKSR